MTDRIRDEQEEDSIFNSIHEGNEPEVVETPTPSEPESATPSEPAPEPAPPVAEEPAPEPTAPPQTEPPAAPPAADAPKQPAARVPVTELQAERRKRQEAEASAEAVRRELAELRGMVQGLNRGQQPAPQPQAKPKPEIWEQPDQFVDERIAPIVQQVQAVKLQTSETIAVEKYGEQAVSDALDALNAHIRANPAGRFDHQQIMASSHPFGSLMKWHEKQRVQTEIGSDPEAWFQRRLEQELEKPEFKQRLAPQPASAPAATGVRPAPVVIPPSVTKATGSPGQHDSGPVSEADIYSAAPSRMGRRVG
jgi:hypothetical protein